MNTTKLNKTTQKAKRWIDDYFNSKCFCVEYFYKNPSTTKKHIELEIRDKMFNNNLINYKILGGNCHCFTVGYTDISENILYIETVSNIYEIDLR
jgi:hypothetical protein